MSTVDAALRWVVLPVVVSAAALGLAGLGATVGYRVTAAVLARTDTTDP